MFINIHEVVSLFFQPIYMNSLPLQLCKEKNVCQLFGINNIQCIMTGEIIHFSLTFSFNLNLVHRIQQFLRWSNTFPVRIFIIGVSNEIIDKKSSTNCFFSSCNKVQNTSLNVLSVLICHLYNTI